MRYSRGLDHSRALELDLRRAYAVEQASSVAEQHGRDVNLQFVDQSSAQELLDRVRAAGDRDVLVAGGCPGLLEGALDAVGDEGERCSSLLGHGLPGMVGEDEY